MKRVESLPEVTIELDGGLPPSLGTSLTAVRVNHQLAAPSQCELRFQTISNAPEELDVVAGASLRVGVEGHSEPLFVGEVTSVEHVFGPAGSKQIWVRGYDLLHRMKKSQPVRTFMNIDVVSLAEELTSSLGLSVESAHDGPAWPILVQYRQSDLELLVDIAQRCGLYPLLDRSTLKLITLEGTGEPLPVVLGDSLLEARVEANGERSCREVVASGWDTATVEMREGTASRPAAGRDVGIEVPPETVGSDGTRALVDEAAGSDAHASGLAQAELDRRFADEVVLNGTAQGDPRFTAGRPIEVKGIGDELSGRYVATSVTHRIDNLSGFLSEIHTAAPPRRTRPRASMTTVGVVTDINDPESIGRIRVRLPSFGDVETDWIAVVSSGAGRGKGLITMPDVEDLVLVLISHEDPGRAFVLGGVYGVDGPPDTGIVEGVVRRYTLVTPGLQKFVLDDDRELVRLEDSTGSYLEMTPEHVRFHSMVDLEIDAPGKAILVRAKTVDFRRAEEAEKPEEPLPPEEPEA